MTQTADPTNGRISFACDAEGCGVVLTTDATNPDAAVAVMRASMWGESHDGERQLHHCPKHAGHAA